MANQASLLTRISTAVLPPKQQFSAWQAIASPDYDATTDNQPDQGYTLEYVGFECGPLKLQHYRRDPGVSIRRPQHVRAANADWFRIQMILNGSSIHRIGDLEYQTRPGGMSVVDQSKTFAVSGAGAELVTFHIDRDQLSRVAPHTDQLHGFWSGAVAIDLFRDHLLSIMRNASSLTPETSAPLFEATSRLLAATLLRTSDSYAAAKPELDAALVRRAQGFIGAHLLKPGLTPDQIARDMGVSRRKLYLLFETQGGVQRYIQQQRLERARQAICNAALGYKIKAVAYDHGFTSEAHFSRSFKRQFGYNATEAREVARTLSPTLSK